MIYLDNSSTSFPKAPGVSERVKDLIDCGCFNIGRGSYAGAWALEELVFETRQKLADLLGCSESKHVIFTGGITQSLNMALKGLLRPGDRVVTTAMEHNAVLRPLTQLQKQGVQVVIAPCDSDGQLLMDELNARITPDTRLVVVTHASNVCGNINPLEQIGSLCRDKDVLLVADAAQSAGVVPIQMEAWGVDVLAFTGHKGLLATQGIGGMLLSRRAANEMEPLLSGGTGSFSGSLEVPQVLPDRFEAGTLNLPGIVALHASLEYIEKTGVENIRNTSNALLERLTMGLKGLPGIRLYGGKNLRCRCPVVSLELAGQDSGELAFRLEEEYGILTRSGLHCAPLAHKALGTFPRGTVRFSMGHTNTPAEIDRTLQALEQISRQ